MDIGKTSEIVIGASRKQSSAALTELDEMHDHIRETHRNIERSRMLLDGLARGSSRDADNYPGLSNI
ncbi:hypothetical protein [Mesorhizobium sp. B1-1-8]|uniref:hypothetical protein n=1 Tax=Mesorhizobium sp. B1-1-8 TaxID=2589976 RepID=UPI001126E4A1|nr:hypothetical protein [Mesorhizobium sp. B1-1-8]UCI06301.1 hypothetical protein FJ974_21135 [Mesorhizobium sp. B1-1-8]